MTQRVYRSGNNTNSESFMSKLLQQREKQLIRPKTVHVSRYPRDRSVSSGSYPGSVAPVAVSSNQHRTKRPTNSIRHQNDASVKQVNAPQNVQREVFSNNSALVEVTVKTQCAKHRSRSSSVRREPWSKLLKSQKCIDDLQSFNNFDPLRTLHFLSKELHTKLQTTVPDEINILQMVCDMQHALKRIPPEVASTIQLQKGLPLKISHNGIREPELVCKDFIEPQKLINVIKPRMIERSCQANLSNTVAEVFRKQLDASTSKLETSCKQMEELCTRIKCEKEETEILLRSEKETVKFLRKKIVDLETSRLHYDTSSGTVKQLQIERNNLEEQIKKLEAQREEDRRYGEEELKSVIHEMQLQISDMERQNMSLKHQLTKCDMEKEKYIAILSFRNSQINETRAEMNELQEIVEKQLMELRSGMLVSSSPSSQCTVSDQGRENPLPSICGGNNIQNNAVRYHIKQPSINCNDPAVQQLYLKDKGEDFTFRELPSGNSSGTSTVLHEMQDNGILKSNIETSMFGNMTPTKNSPHKTDARGTVENVTTRDYAAVLDKQASLRSMFEELKKRASLVHPPPQAPPRTHNGQNSGSDGSMK